MLWSVNNDLLALHPTTPPINTKYSVSRGLKLKANTHDRLKIIFIPDCWLCWMVSSVCVMLSYHITNEVGSHHDACYTTLATPASVWPNNIYLKQPWTQTTNTFCIQYLWNILIDIFLSTNRPELEIKWGDIGTSTVASAKISDCFKILWIYFIE